MTTRWHRMLLLPGGLLPLAVAVAGLLAIEVARAEEAAFDVVEIASTGRSVVADIVDLDGDGRGDLFEVAILGIPPDERRLIRAYFQAEDGSMPTTPSLEVDLPGEAAAYDLGDVLAAPGVEVLFLRARDVAIFSLSGREPSVRPVPVPEGTTLGAAQDERGLDRLRLVTYAFGDPVLVVPGLGETLLIAPDGVVRATFKVGARANYFLRAPGPVLAESDIQVFYDAPRLAFGDIDGDGRPDTFSATRHELRVFLQKEDGSFASAPDRRLPLRMVDEEDHIRGSGSVRSEAVDIDGDGLLDLAISRIAGGITDATSSTSIFFNRGGVWNLEAPDTFFQSEHGASADQLLDVDGDGKLELLQVWIPISVLEIVEVFLTRALDAHMELYMIGDGGRKFESDARFERKIDISLDFDTGRSKGFLPTIDHDLNGDGAKDLLLSRNGDGIEIFLGGEKSDYDKRAARQDVNSEGRARSGDLEGDGLVDLVIYNPRRVDEAVRLLRNQGVLPGSKKQLRAAPARVAPAPGAVEAASAPPSS